MNGHVFTKPGSLRGTPGKTKHQRIGHRLLTEAGYRFLRTDGREHNLYVNASGQRVSVVCSPKNSSEGLNRLRDEIRRNARKQEATVPTQTPEAGVELADELVALADPSMMRPAEPRSPQAKLRQQAFAGWLRRVLERYGPINPKPVEAATARLGFRPHHLTDARKALDVKVLRTEGQHGKWLICLPHQVPEGKTPRRTGFEQPMEVEVVKPEPVAEHPHGPFPHKTFSESTKTAQILSAIDSTEAQRGYAQAAIAEEAQALSNGARPSDAQAAMLMLAETLGLQVPGQEAREALAKAKSALSDAYEALQHAERSLQ